MRVTRRRRSTSSVGLARTAGAYATGLLAEPVSRATQARQPVAQLRQLHLVFTFGAVCVLGENVENDGGAVDGGAAEDLLEVGLLSGAQLVVEDNRVDVEGLGCLSYLGGFPLADVGRRVGGVASLDDPIDGICTGRVDQLGQLVERFVGLGLQGPRKRDSDQQDLLPEGAIDEGTRLSPRTHQSRRGARRIHSSGTSIVAIWLAGPARVTVSPRPTIAEPPGMRTSTRSPAKPQR